MDSRERATVSGFVTWTEIESVLLEPGVAGGSEALVDALGAAEAGAGAEVAVGASGGR